MQGRQIRWRRRPNAGARTGVWPCGDSGVTGWRRERTNLWARCASVNAAPAVADYFPREQPTSIGASMGPGPTVRAATAADCAWIIALTPRLHAFGPPPWRPRDQMDRAVARVVETAILRPTPGATVLAAVDPEDRGLGFIHLHPATGFFTGEAHGHISDLVVARAAAGPGVVRAPWD